MTAGELSIAYRRRTLSPVEVLNATLERVTRIDKSLHAFVAVHADAAMACARRSEARFMIGTAFGPLDGVPVALKDLFDVSGSVTGSGSKAFEGNVAMSDAWLVRRLMHLGATPLGKLALDELGMGDSAADGVPNRPKNPWNTDLSPGGSSSGPAVATSARLCQVTWGTDTGGSVRFPAAWCGVVGFKPTLGRISTVGCLPLSPTLDLVMEAIRGEPAGDDPADRARRSKSSLRVGVPWNFVDTEFQLDADVRSAYTAMIDYFKLSGANITHVELPGMELEPTIYGTILSVEAFAQFRSLLLRPAELGSSTYRRLLVGAFLSPADYACALKGRDLFNGFMHEVMKGVDVLILPTAPNPATQSAGGDRPGWLSPSFRHPFNVTGQPAVTVPAGLSSAGLPIGIQMIGSVFGDDDVLAIAERYEQEHRWRLLAPDF
jgi:aspartyl-tRNA(Asn)/glutamyl-tRNA(Gln) amidotransferase subunit A